MARAKKIDATADVAPSGQPWAYGIRTWDVGGASHGGFIWSLTASACTEAPDWDARPVCGGGLHANQDGWGDWALLSLNELGKILGIVRWDPAEAVDIDGGQKTKAKRMWVVMTTETASMGSIYQFISDRWKARMSATLAAQSEKLMIASKGGEHASATGYRGHASATGYRGHASATGYRGHASATGYRGHASATGDSGHASATGDSGHASATGDSGHASATGDSGHASATGDSGHASATGYRGHASATGYRGHASATGYRGHASATGYRGHASATGDSGHASATGYRGHASATGYRGHASATGDSGIAVSLGGGRAKAAASGAIVLTRWEYVDDKLTLADIAAGMVGLDLRGVTIQANVEYALTVEGVVAAAVA